MRAAFEREEVTMGRYLAALTLFLFGCSGEVPESDPRAILENRNNPVAESPKPPSIRDFRNEGITIKKYLGDVFGYGKVGLEVARNEATGMVYEATVFLLDRQTDFKMENTQPGSDFESVLIFRRGREYEQGRTRRVYRFDPEFEEYEEAAKFALRLLRRPEFEIKGK